MNRRSIRLLSVLLGIGFAAILLAGCNGTAPTASPTARPTLRSTATPAATDTSAPQPSGSVVPSASPSAAASLPLPHFDAALEAKLPDSIGGVTLEKLSWPLSTYIASLKGGGDSVLYAPWLVQFGKNADDIHMAIASDLTDTENFTLQAIQVPGVNSTALIGGFEASAQKQGWPVGPAGPQSARNDWHSGRQAGRMAVMVFLVAAKIKTVVTPWLVSCIKVGVREVKCLPALAQA